MHAIEISYLIASIASVVVMAPQVKQLLATKQSDELNLSTWTVWTLYQATALVYSISLGAIPYMIANLAWITFYGVMLTLIIRYRKTTPIIAVAKVDDSENESIS